MSPVRHSNGATFIQDDFKAPLWSIAPTLAFMKEARARRKIVVLGTISDYQGDPDRIYASVARQALDVADNVVFIGPHARKALRGRRHSQNETLRAFYCVEAAWDYLQDLWQPGDLVLLKDSDQEHLDTLLSERTSGDERPLSPHDHSGVFPMPTGEDTYATAVVGLGNPGKRSQSTPHNVGQRVLDRIAQSLGGEWTRQEQALVARIEWRGIPVYFVKPLTTVNATGLMLVRLIQQLGIGLADCVLVHDDADLSLGTVRVRMRSSDGGHRGVRSVFKAFRTDDLRRVKVGVGRPAQQGQLDDHVMTAFSSVELPIIDQACAEAADRVLELVGGRSNRVRVTDG